MSSSLEILQQAIASLFKRKNMDLLSAKELELLASMELRWFEPAEARKLVDLARELGLLEETEAGLKPKFELDKIEIPLGFKPPKDIITNLEHDSESLFMQMVNHICLITGLDSQTVIAKINEKQAKFEDKIVLETIAILYGKEKDVDMDKFLPMVKSMLLSG